MAFFRRKSKPSSTAVAPVAGAGAVAAAKKPPVKPGGTGTKPGGTGTGAPAKPKGDDFEK